DGRLTLNQGAAANMATRIQYVHIVGLPTGVNDAPSAPTITEPSFDGHLAHPADVHMEAVGYSDPNLNAHKSTDWVIWTVGEDAHPVWQTLGIEGVERLHTHLGDGVFIGDRAGATDLAGDTQYELRVRFRDDAGSVSDWSSRLFQTTPSSTISPMLIQGVANSPAPE